LDLEIIEINDSESEKDGSISNMKVNDRKEGDRFSRHKFLSGTGKIGRVYWTCTK
jgi:hypothetical protein